MSYKLGYIADRVGVPSKAMQKTQLLEYGVSENDIYDNLEDCLASLREHDQLMVYTTAILGRNKINDTFVTLAEKAALGWCLRERSAVTGDYCISHSNLPHCS